MGTTNYEGSMSQEYDNTNSGALFKNERKETENQPDYTGSVNVEGTEFWLSGWIKESKAGKKFMSLSVRAKDENKAERRAIQNEPRRQKGDDIPW